MQSGRLHRYNPTAGEMSEVALLEKEYAAYVSATFCAAFSSCGSAAAGISAMRCLKPV